MLITRRMAVHFACTVLVLASCGTTSSVDLVTTIPQQDVGTSLTPEDTPPPTQTTLTPSLTESTTTTTLSAQGGVALEVVVWDSTSQNPPGDDAVLMVGVDVWSPELEFGGDAHLFSDFPIGTPGTFNVYPDGPGGVEIKVSFVMTSEMISGSDMSMTTVEIYDSEIVVWGQAIPDFEQSYRR